MYTITRKVHLLRFGCESCMEKKQVSETDYENADFAKLFCMQTISPTRKALWQRHRAIKQISYSFWLARLLKLVVAR